MILFPALFKNASVLNPMGQNLSELDRAKYIKGAIFGISGVIKIFSSPTTAEDIAKEVEANEKIRTRLQGKAKPVRDNVFSG